MSDALMGLVILVFFFACIGYVAWCGRIIGPDPEDLEMGTDSPFEAPARSVDRREPASSRS
jgi:hypothetical protein